ncbi:MAG: hypothetical protein ACOX7R_07100 [Acetivibrionales bacterium]|jgi:hypothetical protein
MATFCSCGSLIIENRCTNKKCNIKISEKGVSRIKKADTGKVPAKKPSKSRRASKCITYNLYDMEQPEHNAAGEKA